MPIFSQVMMWNGEPLTIEKSIEVSAQKEKEGDRKEATRFLNHAATLEWEKLNYTSAIKHFEKSLDLNAQIGNENGIISIQNNLGMIYSDLRDFPNSEKYFKEALAGRRKTNEKPSIISSLINLSVVQNNLKKYQESAQNLEEALKYARELNSPDLLKSCYGMLSETYEKAGNSSESRRYFELYRTFHEKSQRDKEGVLKSEAEKARLEAILQEDQKKMAELELELKSQKLREKETALSESDKNIRDLLVNVTKKDLALRLIKQESDNRKKEVEIKNLKIKEEQERSKSNRLVRNGFVIGFVLLGIIVMILFWRYREKQKSNKLLSNQNEEISAQRDHLSELNEEVNQQKEEIEAQRDAIEIEKDKSDKLLLNILPQSVAKELKEKGEATPQHYEMVSVLFTDFQGFTKIAEKLTAEEVIAELNHCFLAFDEICERNNLEKIKTIGDAYMCAGGVPVANQTNAIDTVKAGLEMQAFMEAYKAEKIAKGEPVWEIRLGIHTGEVVAGVIGKNKFAYDIWGDAVNTASRMESSGEAGKVNISGKTYELIRNDFDCTYRGKISAKNKGEVDMYFVVGEKSAN